MQKPHSENQDLTPVVTTDLETGEVELEVFSSRENTEKSSLEIVTKLLTELESISGKENLSSKTSPEAVQESIEQMKVIVEKEEWTFVMSKTGGMPSPGKNVKPIEGCTSPNGFQILQDLREEGEINVDEEADEEENVDVVKSVSVRGGRRTGRRNLRSSVGTVC